MKRGHEGSGWFRVLWPSLRAEMGPIGKNPRNVFGLNPALVFGLNPALLGSSLTPVALRLNLLGCIAPPVASDYTNAAYPLA